MCGRFETTPSIQSLIEVLKKENIDLQLDFESKKNKTINIAPTESIISIIKSDQNYKLSVSKWGIKFNSDSPLIFNSRIETIQEKKYWFNLFGKNRSLVPMTAFYEWKTEGKKKTPYRIFIPNEEIFFVPALYYLDKDQNIYTSLITTIPNDFVKTIHHRMPVIFNIKNGLKYFSDSAESNLLKCIPYAGKMSMEKFNL